MTLATLLPAVTALLEAEREVERQRLLEPLERRLELDMENAFAEQERRFMRLFATLRLFWVEPMTWHTESLVSTSSRFLENRKLAIQEAIEPRDWEPLFTAAELATLRLFERPLNAMARQAMQHGARAAIADVGLGLSFDLAHPEAVAFLQKAPLRIAGINETTRSEIRRILVNGAEQGWSYDRVAKEIQQKFASFRTPMPQQHIRSRAHLVAVTETGDAYVQGTLIVGHDLQRAGLKMEKQWLDTGDERECPTCRGNAADGWIPLEQAFSSGHDAPTAHPACVIGETLVDARGATAVTKRWYDHEVVVIRTASGNNLTCTPNHPILTSGGWVAAGLLNKGNDVISHLGLPRVMAVDNHDQHVPARIEDVAESFRRSLDVTTHEVPLTAEDFHGDAFDGEVAVIWTDGLLRNDQNTVSDCGHDLTLQRRSMVLGAFPTERRFAKRLECLSSTPASNVGSLGIAPVLVRASARHHQAIGSRTVSALDAFSEEAPPDGVAIYAELTRQGIFGLTPEIFRDEITAVDRHPFRGHVYNLEMPNGWYLANGILTHNCRCDVQQRAVLA